jgi:hypothetical protein
MENNGIALNYNEKKMSNLTLKKITNKLEAEIKDLQLLIPHYELAKCKYTNFKYYTDLQNDCLAKCQEYEPNERIHEEYQRVIKYTANMCCSLNKDKDNEHDFDILRNIEKKKELIEQFKTWDNQYTSTMLEIVKNTD